MTALRSSIAEERFFYSSAYCCVVPYTKVDCQDAPTMIDTVIGRIKYYSPNKNMVKNG